MNSRESFQHHWLVRVLGAILVASTGHSARAADPVATDTPVPWIESAVSTSKLVGGLAEAAELGSAEMVDVVVTYDSVQSAQDDAAESPFASRGGRTYTRLPFRAVRLPASDLGTLSQGARVRYVSPDSEVTGASVASREAARVPGSLTAPLSPNAYYRGHGVRVAVVDTGVANHPDFYSLVGQFDFVGGAAGVPTTMEDGFGHGTHVAGMIGGTGGSSWSQKYQGVATEAGIVGLRVLDDQGRGNMSDVLAALDWIIEVGITQYGIRVANLSLGKGVEQSQASDPLVQAVEAVWDAGVVVVVSAGNHGESGHFTVASPGNSRKVITVGSLTDRGTGAFFYDDYVSTFSSRGPTLFDHVLKPDLVAPGNRIVAPFAPGSNLGGLVGPDRVFCGYSGMTSCTSRYMRLSGTSMAAGLVSGAVARMLEKDPSLRPATVKARLMKSARKMSGDPTETGAGVLDVDAAMDATGVMTTEALSPLMLLSTDTDIAFVEDTAELWGADWAAGYLWTDGFLWTNASAMGANGFLWSNSYLWSNSSAWANAYLWSNGFLWSDAVRPASIDVEDPDEAQP